MNWIRFALIGCLTTIPAVGFGMDVATARVSPVILFDASMDHHTPATDMTCTPCLLPGDSGAVLLDEDVLPEVTTDAPCIPARLSIDNTAEMRSAPARRLPSHRCGPPSLLLAPKQGPPAFV